MLRTRTIDYWKREFFKRRFKFTLVFVGFVGLLFLCFQAISFSAISQSSMKRLIRHIKVDVRGINPYHAHKYIPNSRGNFQCISSKKEINFKLVNDDYCDCPADGSDEPGTNACSNSAFYCESEESWPRAVHSSRVNDGICDCCDGSDESAQIFYPHRLNELKQKQLGRYQSPCPNLCPDDV